jgi:hypothetical protein
MIYLINNMTAKEFNKKYEVYLETGHYGMSFNDDEIMEYLDTKFQEFIKIPGFLYTQIKIKFGMTRFYCSPNTIDSYEVEKYIDNILNKK